MSDDHEEFLAGRHRVGPGGGGLRVQVGTAVLGGSGATVAHVAGEVDLGNARALCEALDGAARRGGILLVDLGDMSFIDSAGMVVLDGVAARLRRAGGRLVVRNPRPLTRKLIGIMGLSELLPAEGLEGAGRGSGPAAPEPVPDPGEPDRAVQHLHSAGLALHECRSRSTDAEVVGRIDEAMAHLDAAADSLRQAMLGRFDV